MTASASPGRAIDIGHRAPTVLTGSIPSGSSVHQGRPPHYATILQDGTISREILQAGRPAEIRTVQPSLHVGWSGSWSELPPYVRGYPFSSTQADCKRGSSSIEPSMPEGF